MKKKSHNYSVAYDGTNSGDGDGPMPSSVSHDSSPDSTSHELHENVLDSHHETLMKADAIRGNDHIMKQLKPHMEKKMGAMQKILSIDGLKKAAKKKQLE